jgi:Transglycosylase associated protein
MVNPDDAGDARPLDALPAAARVASLLFGFLGITFAGWIGYLIAGFIGACILIAIARAFSGGLQQRT